MSLIHKFIQDNEHYVIDVNSGALHMVDEIVYDLLDENELRKKEDLIEDFKNKYSIEDINEVYDEIQSLIQEETLYTGDLYKSIALSGAKEEPYIKALCLNIIHDCNLRCKYCFADEGEYHGARKAMSVEVGKKSIDFVLEKSGPRKNIEIDLFGGEPLMAFEMIKEIVKYARVQEKIYKKSIRFTMTTNATLFNDEIMKYMDENMGNIVLSIDGRKAVNDKVRVKVDGSGSYDNILPKIKKMVDMRDKSKQYYVRGTFTRENTDFFEDIKHMADLGFEEISIEPVVLPPEHNLSLREEDLPVIFEQYDKLYADMLKRYKDGTSFKFYHFNIDLKGGPCVYKRIAGCGAGHEYVAITPDGDIYPCHQFVGNKDFLIGDIYTGITNKKMVKEFKEAHIYNKPTCTECWAKFYCSGGCQANNFNFNGDMHIPYEIGCKMQKKRIECAIALKAQTMNK
ncbi:thioether cross-link-forming SCIFF peptide maturase [Clostridium estertheticum]|uniref:thioether cross-link-forming SCIFF peptide maturase n=1 Tax=Clostridium estertheticum TaxID=238834 RepID=UPI001C6EA7F0|nr:thioether cross-link-forming SCIFF peptide maturase [Clostridium estertheticum]MBW9152746.1 thioether cross-link-forming SCIFF peptide maturase [Clostridium estertheticum]WLC85708.1 thioether cross-link-forming SCIFF peptide maturase [Clostridium estertheticum]